VCKFQDNVLNQPAVARF